jgi:hypothetical protein
MSIIITPIVGFTALGSIVFGIINGDGWRVLEIAGFFTVVHYLMTALAIRIDDEDPKLLLYAGFLLFGFKQIIDFLLIKALIEQLLGREAKWTSAKRIGTEHD